MRASVHVKLPKLSSDSARFTAIAEKYHLDIRGIDGEHSESKGGITFDWFSNFIHADHGNIKNKGVFDVSNKRRLGYSEAQLVLDMYNGVNELIEVEKSLWNRIKPYSY